MVVEAVPHELAIATECVVVELGVPDQPHPLHPARGDVVPSILIQILAKISCRGNIEIIAIIRLDQYTFKDIV